MLILTYPPVCIKPLALADRREFSDAAEDEQPRTANVAILGKVKTSPT